MEKSCKVFQAHLFSATGEGQTTFFLVFCFNKETSLLITVVELKPTLDKFSHPHATLENKKQRWEINNFIRS